MKIQSLSVVVPNKKCINNCAFCVSKMHKEEYINQFEENNRFFDLYLDDYKKRLMFARDNGCNTVMLTGDSEPQQNKQFLKMFGMINDSLPMPFRKIEIQTTGVLLDDEYLRFLRNTVGVSTISLSVSDIFDDNNNRKINGTVAELKVKIEKLCSEIKRYDFNLRISVNLTDAYTFKDIKDIFKRLNKLGADQVTFRRLYCSKGNDKQNKWISHNSACTLFVSTLRKFILTNGIPLRKLEYGQTLYSIAGMSTVLDEDCMSKELKEDLKYLILRPNAKLYSQWDDKASLIF